MVGDYDGLEGLSRNGRGDETSVGEDASIDEELPGNRTVRC
jgi:hypothetical protein